MVGAAMAARPRRARPRRARPRRGGSRLLRRARGRPLWSSSAPARVSTARRGRGAGRHGRASLLQCGAARASSVAGAARPLAELQPPHRARAWRRAGVVRRIASGGGARICSGGGAPRVPVLSSRRAAGRSSSRQRSSSPSHPGPAPRWSVADVRYRAISSGRRSR
jgi:hypothetical protein